MTVSAGSTGRKTQRAEGPAILGALALLMGVFAPALTVEIYGTVSYFDAFEGPGTALVITAAASLLAVFRRTWGWLALAAPAAWIALLWPVVGRHLWPKDENLFDQLFEAVGDEVGRVAGNFALRITDFSTGSWLLLLGCTLLTLAALRTRRPVRSR